MPLAERMPNIKRCPVPTSVYTGREDQIKQVGSCITGGADERRVCVVHGLGGAGKTQLALKTIERNRDHWKHVLYVDASSREAIMSTLQDFAEAKIIGKTHGDALTWFESCREPWLMMFDNADHPSLRIHEYFPGGNHGAILITTRLPDLTVHARGPVSVCHVSRMDDGDSLALFLKAARIHGQGVIESEFEAATALLEVRGRNLVALIPLNWGHNMSGFRPPRTCNRTRWCIHRSLTSYDYIQVSKTVSCPAKTHARSVQEVAGEA